MIEENIFDSLNLPIPDIIKNSPIEIQREVFEYLNDNMDDIQWEKKPLLDIAKDKQLVAFKHYGFWKPMDALRDRIELEQLWNSGQAKWKIWE